jgi:hypothetical protein
VVAVPRYRIRPPVEKKVVAKVAPKVAQMATA